MTLIPGRMTRIPPRMALIPDRMTDIPRSMTLIRGQKTEISRPMTPIFGQMILIPPWKGEIFRGKTPAFHPMRKNFIRVVHAGGTPGHVFFKESSRLWWIDPTGFVTTIRSQPSS